MTRGSYNFQKSSDVSEAGKFRRLYVFILVLLFMSPAGVKSNNEALEFMDSLYEAGRYWFEEHAPEVIRNHVDIPQRHEWAQFWQFVEDTHRTMSYEDMAWIRPEAETALKLLKSTPIGEPYAVWLEQYMHYIHMAESAVRSVYGQSHRDRVNPQPGQGIIPPPRPRVLPAQVKSDVQVQRIAGDQSKWERKLSVHPPPGMAESLVPSLKSIFESEGTPSEWVWLAEVESSFNPKARSPVGATGLFQFMPATAESFGLQLSPTDDRLDPYKSARAAARYLRYLHDRFDSWPLTLAAYNAGEGRVGRLLDRHGGKAYEDIADYLPVETQMYVPKVLATVSIREGIDPLTLPAPGVQAASL